MFVFVQLLAFYSDMQGVSLDLFDTTAADVEMSAIIDDIEQLLLSYV